MNYCLRFLLIVLSFLLVQPIYAQLEIREGSFRQLSRDVATAERGQLNMGDLSALIDGKKYDDNGILCALLKIKIEKISRTDIAKLDFRVNAGIQVVEKRQFSGELWVHITGAETDMLITHPSFGASNKITMRLEGGKTYEIRLSNGETADMTFLSRPVGASIYLDNNYIGKTTENGLSATRVAYGPHNVRAEYGGIAEEQSFEITEASPRVLSFRIVPKKHFDFTSSPQGADILVDGQKMGVTPVSLELSLELHKIKAIRGGKTDSLELDFARATSNAFTFNFDNSKNAQKKNQTHTVQPKRERTNYAAGVALGYVSRNIDAEYYGSDYSYRDAGVQIGFRYEPLFKTGKNAIGMNTGLLTDIYPDSKCATVVLPIDFEYRYVFSKTVSMFLYTGFSLNYLLISDSAVEIDEEGLLAYFDVGGGVRIKHLRIHAGYNAGGNDILTNKIEFGLSLMF
ncbi:MAG: hypothetical protein LBR06_05050 [Bacteroidales bacterium]|jgi:hypothetical protein|nr:hypothetical protein [Bacteroidales bacterium]